RERQLWRCGAREGDVVEELGDIIQEFLVESHENLDQLDRDLVSLEEQPQSRELVSRIFRTIHTIKGTSGFLAFTNLESVTHAGESLLFRLRDGTQPVTADTISTLLAMVDSVRSLLASIEESGGEGEIGIDTVVSMINRQMEPGDATAAAGTSEPAAAAQPATPEPAAATSAPRKRAAAQKRAPKAAAPPGPAEPVALAEPAPAEPVAATEAVAPQAEPAPDRD